MSEQDDNTLVRSLDMADGHDRTLARKAIKRWPVDDDFKAQAVRALRVALSIAIRKESARDIRSVVATLKDIEGQNQSDEHLEEKHARTDDGKPDAITEIRVTRAAKELPSGDD
jgi:hypothetical protein